jgi:hypothetical protein
MKDDKIKFKKQIFNLVKTIGNDMELGKEVRKLTVDYISSKLEKSIKKEKTKGKTKLPKVDKDKVDNFSKIAVEVWETKKEKKRKKDGTNK